MCIYMMLTATVIAAFLSHWIDAAVLFGAVIVNAVIGFVQERASDHHDNHAGRRT